MKPYQLIIIVALFIVNIHCRNNHTTRQSANVSFTVEETDGEYHISADYDPKKTKAVESVLDHYLKQDNDPSFTNTQIDAEMTMSDKTTFHIKHTSGDLNIEMNKSKNSKTALLNFKEMAEQLKKAL